MLSSQAVLQSIVFIAFTTMRKLSLVYQLPSFALSKYKFIAAYGTNWLALTKPSKVHIHKVLKIYLLGLRSWHTHTHTHLSLYEDVHTHTSGLHMNVHIHRHA